MLRSWGIEGFETDYSASEFFDAKPGYAKLAKTLYRKIGFPATHLSEPIVGLRQSRKLAKRAAAVLANEFEEINACSASQPRCFICVLSVLNACVGAHPDRRRFRQ
jgi:hypothetical protein